MMICRLVNWRAVTALATMQNRMRLAALVKHCYQRSLIRSLSCNMAIKLSLVKQIMNRKHIIGLSTDNNHTHRAAFVGTVNVG